MPHTDSPFERDFECVTCGSVTAVSDLNASRPSYSERLLDCGNCASIQPHKRIPNGFPRLDFKTDDGIPNKAADLTELNQWQNEQLIKYRDKLHPDNFSEYKGLKHLTGSD